MLTFGIDVLVLAIIGIVNTVVVALVCMMIGATKEQGDAAVSASVVTMFTMLVGYITMAHMLDAMLGAFGW